MKNIFLSCFCALMTTSALAATVITRPTGPIFTTIDPRVFIPVPAPAPAPAPVPAPSLPDIPADAGIIYLRAITMGRDTYNFMKPTPQGIARTLTFSVYKTNSYTKIIYSDFIFSNHDKDTIDLRIMLNGNVQTNSYKNISIRSFDHYSLGNGLKQTPFSAEWVFFNLAPGTYRLSINPITDASQYGGSGTYGIGSAREDWRLEVQEMSWPYPTVRAGGL